MKLVAGGVNRGGVEGLPSLGNRSEAEERSPEINGGRNSNAATNKFTVGTRETARAEGKKVASVRQEDDNGRYNVDWMT